ncbi:MAG: tRNA-dihydrouridine synthase [Phycisphaerales bacterium]|nr:tRNA-dihydrouridine synthase [Phycisphaerales bacterium]
MLATPLQLGPVRLHTNLLLAPIAGWCDLAWRCTVRSLGGVALACTDLLSPHGLLCNSEASLDLARTNDFDKPIGMQLYGCDPDLLADGARWCADHGATVVDINMGCPVDKICKKDGGSKLMCIPDTAQRIVEAVRAALPDHIPLTAKMRLGWNEADASNNAAGSLSCRLIAAGVCAVTVHGRTTEQRFTGACRREGIRRVVESVAERFGRYDGTPAGGPPVIGNGDIRRPFDVVDMIRQTGCAGVMIGRGAFAMPWIFAAAWAEQHIAQADRAGCILPPGRLEASAHASMFSAYSPPTELEKLQILRTYFDLMRQYRDDRYAMFRIRQKISWLGRNINNSHCHALKEGIRLAKTPAQVHAAIDAWEATMPTRLQTSI